MAFLNSTKYANNIRSVSGLNVFVFPDDVVLNCQTSGGAVSINLLEIPANYWNTTYKLYVNDASNNASVNNITINAPAGYSINGAASIVINTNGGGVLIRITDNTTYMATANSTGGGGGGYNTIEDEGVALPQRTIMNFIGAGVTASDVGGKTQIDITGGIIDIANSNLLTLIANNSVIIGQYYRIIDPANAPFGVVVTGIRTNGVSTYGVGLFANADYQAVGDYSGIIGFAGNIGIWDSTPRAVVANNVVIYNNKHYLNLSGSWGSAPDVDTTNWSLLNYSLVYGYILSCDLVNYNISSALVTKRIDSFANDVDYYQDGKGNEAIRDFQWGRNAVKNNKVLSNSLMLCTNSNNSFTANYLTTESVLQDDSPFTSSSGSISNNVIEAGSILQSGNNSGDISCNTITSKSSLVVNLAILKSEIIGNFLSSDSSANIETIQTTRAFSYNNIITNGSFKCTGTMDGDVVKNTISNDSTLEISSITIPPSNITSCNICDNISINLGAVTTTYAYYTYRQGYSNWEADLDFATTFAIGSLTIPISLNYVGKFNTLNSFGLTVTDIINLPTNHAVTLTPDNNALPNDFTLQYTAVGLVIPNKIIRAFAAASDTFTARAGNGSDIVILKKNGTLNTILSKYNWQ